MHSFRKANVETSEQMHLRNRVELFVEDTIRALYKCREIRIAQGVNDDRKEVHLTLSVREMRNKFDYIGIEDNLMMHRIAAIFKNNSLIVVNRVNRNEFTISTKQPELMSGVFNSFRDLQNTVLDFEEREKQDVSG